MGTSPGKWIKTVLFRKKSSKSKGTVLAKKAAPELPVGDLCLNHSSVTDTTYQNTDVSGEKAESEKCFLDSTPSEIAASLPAKQPIESSDGTSSASADDEETRRLEQAATKAQAAFRSYLARRAFWALKSIIQLQALIRGRLVRRQAAATLHCMHSIVRLQALARGQMVRLSYPALKLCAQDTTRVDSLGMSTTSWTAKLATDTFASKLLASSPKAMALSLHYVPDEPNSAWNWLERWSLLQFWVQLAHSKTVVDSKSGGKQGGTKLLEGEAGKSRKTFRKVATATTNETASSSFLEVDKPKRYLRKSASHHSESPNDQPNELERVKRSLRKVSATTMPTSEKFETEFEKPLQSLRKSTVPTPDMFEPATVTVLENTSESTFAVDKLVEKEMPAKQLNAEESANLPFDNSVIEQNSMENVAKVEINETVNEESNTKEDQNGRENQRTRRRRSLPTKEEYPENVSQNTPPSLPSYMAATKSAKAKLRMQGSVKFGEDGVENGFVRRHSLPTATSGQLNSSSPRFQKLAQINGKGGPRSNKSSSSRDERVLQPGWRR